MDEFIMQQERQKQDDAKQDEIDRLEQEKLLFEQELIR
jgi:hypothetical protein